MRNMRHGVQDSIHFKLDVEMDGRH